MGDTVYPRPVPPGTVDKSNWGLRYGSNDPKGLGFLGVLGRPDGGVSSELSIGVNVNGKDVEVPSMVPTLTPQQRQTLLSLRDGQPMPQDIVDTAVAFAKTRIAQGLSPFASDAESPDNVSLDAAYAREKNNYAATPQKVNPMGDVYQNIDFERMLSDLGQALERNKGGAPGAPAPVYPKPAEPGGVPTARFPDVPPAPAAGAQQVPPMTVQGAPPGPPPPMSPADQATMAQLQALAPQAYGMGYGSPQPHPAHAPPPMIAQQLAGIDTNPTAAVPAGVYPQLAPPNLDPNADGGLAGYAALR